MSRSQKTARIIELAEHLLGTCKSLEDGLREFGITEQLSAEECMILDNNAMLCDGCGWWVEPEEIQESGVCEDCTEKGIEA